MAIFKIQQENCNFFTTRNMKNKIRIQNLTKTGQLQDNFR